MREGKGRAALSCGHRAVPGLLALAVIFLGGCAEDTRLVRADLLKGRIDLDGRLLEPGWRDAPSIDGFAIETPARPLTAADADIPVPAPPSTEAFVLWDERFLYFAFSCADEDLVGGREGARDEVEIRLRVGGERTESLRVTISLPQTVIVEGHVGPGDLPSGGVEAATSVFGSPDDGGDIDRFYSVEVRIPFAALGLEPFALSRPERIEVRLLRREVSRGHRMDFVHPQSRQQEGQERAWGDLLLSWD